MIWLPGDFPFWMLLVGGCVVGLTTALLIGAAAAIAAGTTAYGVKAATEGNFPWTDPEAYFTGFSKSLVSPIGAVIDAARGEDTISEQLKDLTGEISRGGGSGSELQTATGQGPAKLSAEAQMARGVPAPSQPQPMGGQGEGGGGAMRYDAMDAAEEPASRKDILGGAWKDIGIQAAIQAGAAAIPYVGGAIGSAVAPAVGAAVAPAISAATQAAVPAVAGVAAEVAPAVASTAAAAAPSFATTALEGLQAIPSFIGDNATGILQKTLTQGLMGAGKGALSSLASGDDPGRGALFGGATGGAGGFAGGVGGFGASAFAPDPVPTLGANPFPMPEIGAPSMVGGMAPGAPTLTSSIAGQVPRVAGSAASGLVGHLMQPSQPSQPGEPVYSSRPSYYDVYDIGGQNATYGGRRPYWG